MSVRTHRVAFAALVLKAASTGCLRVRPYLDILLCQAFFGFGLSDHGRHVPLHQIPHDLLRDRIDIQFRSSVSAHYNSNLGTEHQHYLLDIGGVSSGCQQPAAEREKIFLCGYTGPLLSETLLLLQIRLLLLSFVIKAGREGPQ